MTREPTPAAAPCLSRPRRHAALRILPALPSRCARRTPPPRRRARPARASARDRPRKACAGPSLTPAQRAALEPLERDWPAIDAARKRKWLEIAGALQQLPPDERARVQERMTDWARLTPAERGQARLRFQEARAGPAARPQERWDAYQALPPEQRQQLAARAATAASAAARRRIERRHEAAARRQPGQVEHRPEPGLRRAAEAGRADGGPGRARARRRR